jgi:hypothetical protein
MTRYRPLYTVSNETLPELPARTELFTVAPELVPYMLGKLEIMRRSNPWEDGTNKQVANNLLGEQMMALLQPVQGVDRLYRLLDTALNGTEYTYTEDGGVITITPSIPIVPAATDAALLPSAAKTRETLTFLVSGSELYTTPLTSDMSLQSRLQAVIDAINGNGTDNEAIIAELAQILLALA